MQSLWLLSNCSVLPNQSDFLNSFGTGKLFQSVLLRFFEMIWKLFPGFCDFEVTLKYFENLLPTQISTLILLEQNDGIVITSRLLGVVNSKIVIALNELGLCSNY
jgi:hypothetical protein